MFNPELGLTVFGTPMVTFGFASWTVSVTALGTVFSITATAQNLDPPGCIG